MRRLPLAAAAAVLLILGLALPARSAPPGPDLCPDLTGDALTRCLYSELDDRIAALEPSPSAEPTPTASPSADPTPSDTPSATVEPTTTPTPSETPTPTASAAPTPSETPTPSPTGAPVGGFTKLAFSDDFDGTELDRAKWAPCWYPASFPAGSDSCGNMNPSGAGGTATLKSNVSVHDGNLWLNLSGDKRGALVNSDKGAGAGVGYRVTSEAYAEARVWFPGDAGGFYNWPAWWVNGPASGFSDGEIDVAETNSGRQMQHNYHWGSTTTNNQLPSPRTIPAKPNTWHTYGVWQRAGENVAYLDGVEVRRYRTYDNLASKSLIFNVGQKDGAAPVIGQPVRVDWVKVWTR